tara:strand:+ start:9630 stop:10355 length:726 start_codon:yes stop_codon:yes gene_type:complete
MKLLRKIYNAAKLFLSSPKAFKKHLFKDFGGSASIFFIYIFFLFKKIFLIKNKKRLFIDCGSNLGQGFSFFKQIFPLNNYDYLLIEPNYNCTKELKKKYNSFKNIKIINAAVWIEDGMVDLYGLNESNNIHSDGASIIDNHNSNYYKVKRNKAIKVKSLDFSSLLRRYSSYEEIIVKMDIESSEYAVLDKLIFDNTIDLIDTLFVEFHSYSFSGDKRDKYAAKEQDYLKILPKHTRFFEWY